MSTTSKLQAFGQQRSTRWCRTSTQAQGLQQQLWDWEHGIMHSKDSFHSRFTARGTLCVLTTIPQLAKSNHCRSTSECSTFNHLPIFMAWGQSRANAIGFTKHVVVYKLTAMNQHVCTYWAAYGQKVLLSAYQQDLVISLAGPPANCPLSLSLLINSFHVKLQNIYMHTLN